MNESKLFALAGDIEDSFVAESMKPVSRRPRYIRYAAAAAALLLVFGAAFGIAKAASANGPDIEAGLPDKSDPPAVPEDAVLPPSRMGASGKSIKIRGPYSIKSSLEEAEAVCILTIGNWLYEDDDETFFEASVDKVICGELPERIVFCQHGNSNWTLKGFPLFTYGDRLLVYLRGVTWNAKQEENCYTMVGVWSAFFYVEEVEGVEYAIDRAGIFTYYTRLRESGFNVRDHSHDTALVDSLIKRTARYDTLLSDWLSKYFRVFLKDEGITEFNVSIYELSELESYILGE